jgi:hypothetical protein
MRSSAFIPLVCLLARTSALQLPNFQPFLSAFPLSVSDYIAPQQNNETAESDSRHDLLRRQFSNTCPTGFSNCANMGAPQLCCITDAVCSADYAGNVACCPTGAACSGTIGGVITAGTVDSSGYLVGAGGATTTGPTGAASTSFQFAQSTTTTTSSQLSVAGLVPATTQSTVGNGDATTSGGGFVLNGGSTVATPGFAVRGAQAVSICVKTLDDGRLRADCSLATNCQGDHKSARVSPNLTTTSECNIWFLDSARSIDQSARG